MKNNMIQKKKVIFENPPRNTLRIWEAEYDEQKCYAIEHISSGHMELIDYDQNICSSIIEFISQNGTIYLRYGKGTRGFVLKMKGPKNTILLRLFMFAMYTGIECDKVSGKQIGLRDRSLIEYDVIDLRSSNLYRVSGFLPKKNGIEIMPIARDGGDPEYLMIKMQRFDAVEFMDFSHELYEMLATSELCCLSYKQSARRTLVNVRGSEPVTVNLSRFLKIYEREFYKYKGENEPIRQFIFDFPKLSSQTPREADHVNAYKFINCKENLLLIDGALNDSKSDDIHRFKTGGVEVNTAVTPEQEVLIEYQFPDGKCAYYKCPTPEDLANWQKVFLGKDVLTKNTKIVTDKDGTWVHLKDIFSRRKEPKPTCDEMIRLFWEWVDNKNRLLAMHAANKEQFRRYPDILHLKAVPVPDEVGMKVASIHPEYEFMGRRFTNVQILVEKISNKPEQEK